MVVGLIGSLGSFASGAQIRPPEVSTVELLCAPTAARTEANSEETAKAEHTGTELFFWGFDLHPFEL